MFRQSDRKETRVVFATKLLTWRGLEADIEYILTRGGGERQSGSNHPPRAETPLFRRRWLAHTLRIGACWVLRPKENIMLFLTPPRPKTRGRQEGERAGRARSSRVRMSAVECCGALSLGHDAVLSDVKHSGCGHLDPTGTIHTPSRQGRCSWAATGRNWLPGKKASFLYRNVAATKMPKLQGTTPHPCTWKLS